MLTFALNKKLIYVNYFFIDVHAIIIIKLQAEVFD